VGKQLVTIATFDQPAQARLAKNALDEAGIRSAVNDESLVAMDWLLSNAVGGIKVQVWEEDADRAVSVLERNFGEDGQGLGTKISPEELAAQAEAATPEEGEEPDAERPAPSTPSEPESADAPPTPESREDYARRMVFTSMLGLVFPPIAAYAVYLFLNAAFGEGTLSSRGRMNLFVGGMMTLAGLVWFTILLRYTF
jgi:hypothetical protein